MSSPFSANLAGFTALEDRLKQLAGAESTKIAQAALRAGAAKMAKAAKAAAPIGPTPEGHISNRKTKSGRIRQEKHQKISNHIKVVKVRSGAGSVDAKVQINAYQASFVEFGSIHNAPNPWFRQTFDQNSQVIIDQIAAILDKRLIKAGV